METDKAPFWKDPKFKRTVKQLQALYSARLAARQAARKLWQRSSNYAAANRIPNVVSSAQSQVQAQRKPIMGMPDREMEIIQRIPTIQQTVTQPTTKTPQGAPPVSVDPSIIQGAPAYYDPQTNQITNKLTNTKLFNLNGEVIPTNQADDGSWLVPDEMQRLGVTLNQMTEAIYTPDMLEQFNYVPSADEIIPPLGFDVASIEGENLYYDPLTHRITTTPTQVQYFWTPDGNEITQQRFAVEHGRLIPNQEVKLDANTRALIDAILTTQKSQADATALLVERGSPVSPGQVIQGSNQISQTDYQNMFKPWVKATQEAEVLRVGEQYSETGELLKEGTVIFTTPATPGLQLPAGLSNMLETTPFGRLVMYVPPWNPLSWNPKTKAIAQEAYRKVLDRVAGGLIYLFSESNWWLKQKFFSNARDMKRQSGFGDWLPSAAATTLTVAVGLPWAAVHLLGAPFVSIWDKEKGAEWRTFGEKVKREWQNKMSVMTDQFLETTLFYQGSPSSGLSLSPTQYDLLMENYWTGIETGANQTWGDYLGESGVTAVKIRQHADRMNGKMTIGWDYVQRAQLAWNEGRQEEAVTLMTEGLSDILVYGLDYAAFGNYARHEFDPKWKPNQVGADAFLDKTIPVSSEELDWVYKLVALNNAEKFMSLFAKWGTPEEQLTLAKNLGSGTNYLFIRQLAMNALESGRMPTIHEIYNEAFPWLKGYAANPMSTKQIREFIQKDSIAFHDRARELALISTAYEKQANAWGDENVAEKERLLGLARKFMNEAKNLLDAAYELDRKAGGLDPFAMYSWDAYPEKYKEFKQRLAEAEIQLGRPPTRNEIIDVGYQYADFVYEASGEAIIDVFNLLESLKIGKIAGEVSKNALTVALSKSKVGRNLTSAWMQTVDDMIESRRIRHMKNRAFVSQGFKQQQWTTNLIKDIADTKPTSKDELLWQVQRAANQINAISLAKNPEEYQQLVRSARNVLPVTVSERSLADARYVLGTLDADKWKDLVDDVWEDASNTFLDRSAKEIKRELKKNPIPTGMDVEEVMRNRIQAKLNNYLYSQHGLYKIAQETGERIKRLFLREHEAWAGSIFQKDTWMAKLGLANLPPEKVGPGLVKFRKGINITYQISRWFMNAWVWATLARRPAWMLFNFYDNTFRFLVSGSADSLHDVIYLMKRYVGIDVEKEIGLRAEVTTSMQAAAFNVMIEQTGLGEKITHLQSILDFADNPFGFLSHYKSNYKVLTDGKNVAAHAYAVWRAFPLSVKTLASAIEVGSRVRMYYKLFMKNVAKVNTPRLLALVTEGLVERLIKAGMSQSDAAKWVAYVRDLWNYSGMHVEQFENMLSHLSQTSKQADVIYLPKTLKEIEWVDEASVRPLIMSVSDQLQEFISDLVKGENVRKLDKRHSDMFFDRVINTLDKEVRARLDNVFNKQRAIIEAVDLNEARRGYTAGKYTPEREVEETVTSTGEEAMKDIPKSAKELTPKQRKKAVKALKDNKIATSGDDTSLLSGMDQLRQKSDKLERKKIKPASPEKMKDIEENIELGTKSGRPLTDAEINKMDEAIDAAFPGGRRIPAGQSEATSARAVRDYFGRADWVNNPAFAILDEGEKAQLSAHIINLVDETRNYSARMRSFWILVFPGPRQFDSAGKLIFTASTKRGWEMYDSLAARGWYNQSDLFDMLLDDVKAGRISLENTLTARQMLEMYGFDVEFDANGLLSGVRVHDPISNEWRFSSSPVYLNQFKQFTGVGSLKSYETSIQSSTFGVVAASPRGMAINAKIIPQPFEDFDSMVRNNPRLSAYIQQNRVKDANILIASQFQYPMFFTRGGRNIPSDLRLMNKIWSDLGDEAKAAYKVLDDVPPSVVHEVLSRWAQTSFGYRLDHVIRNLRDDLIQVARKQYGWTEATAREWFELWNRNFSNFADLISEISDRKYTADELWAAVIQGFYSQGVPVSATTFVGRDGRRLLAHSYLMDFVDRRMGAVATGSEILAGLKKVGMNEAELKWNGLFDWLMQRKDDVLAKADFATFINQQERKLYVHFSRGGGWEITIESMDEAISAKVSAVLSMDADNRFILTVSKTEEGFDALSRQRLERWARDMGVNRLVIENKTINLDKIVDAPRVEPLLSGSGILGSTTWLADQHGHLQAILRAFPGANVTTSIHEPFHAIEALLREHVPEAARVLDDWADTTLLAMKEKDSRMWKQIYQNLPQEAARREVKARAFEKYIITATAPNKEVGKIFKAIRSYLVNFYRLMKDYFDGIYLTPEVRKIFDQMVGDGWKKSKADTLPKPPPTKPKPPVTPPTPPPVPETAAVKAAKPAKAAKAAPAPAPPPPKTPEERTAEFIGLKPAEPGAPPPAAAEKKPLMPPLAKTNVRVVHFATPDLERSIRKDGLKYAQQGTLKNAARIYKRAEDVILVSDDPRMAEKVAFVFDIPKRSLKFHNNPELAPGRLRRDALVGVYDPMDAKGLRKKRSEAGKRSAAKRAEAKAKAGKVDTSAAAKTEVQTAEERTAEFIGLKPITPAKKAKSTTPAALASKPPAKKAKPRSVEVPPEPEAPPMTEFERLYGFKPGAIVKPKPEPGIRPKPAKQVVKRTPEEIIATRLAEDEMERTGALWSQGGYLYPMQKLKKDYSLGATAQDVLDDRIKKGKRLTINEEIDMSKIRANTTAWVSESEDVATKYAIGDEPVDRVLYANYRILAKDERGGLLIHYSVNPPQLQSELAPPPASVEELIEETPKPVTKAVVPYQKALSVTERRRMDAVSNVLVDELRIKESSGQPFYTSLKTLREDVRKAFTGETIVPTVKLRRVAGKRKKVVPTEKEIDDVLASMGLDTVEKLAAANRKMVEKYVEKPCQPLVRKLLKEGHIPYASNAYGPGWKGVWYYKKGIKRVPDLGNADPAIGFAPLEDLSYLNKALKAKKKPKPAKFDPNLATVPGKVKYRPRGADLMLYPDFEIAKRDLALLRFGEDWTKMPDDLVVRQLKIQFNLGDDADVMLNNAEVIQKYVEEPARPLVEKLLKDGYRVTNANAYGIGKKGVYWIDNAGVAQFTELPDLNYLRGNALFQEVGRYNTLADLLSGPPNEIQEALLELLHVNSEREMLTKLADLEPVIDDLSFKIERANYKLLFKDFNSAEREAIQFIVDNYIPSSYILRTGVPTKPVQKYIQHRRNAANEAFDFFAVESIDMDAITDPNQFFDVFRQGVENVWNSLQGGARPEPRRFSSYVMEILEQRGFVPEEMLKLMWGEQAGKLLAGGREFRVIISPDTPEFNSFINGSKVMDSTGRIVPMYHATPRNFRSFLVTEDGGYHFGEYLTSMDKAQFNPEWYVHGYWLAVKNPIDMLDRGSWGIRALTEGMADAKVITREVADKLQLEAYRIADEYSLLLQLMRKNTTEPLTREEAIRIVGEMHDTFPEELKNGNFGVDELMATWDYNLAYQNSSGPTWRAVNIGNRFGTSSIVSKMKSMGYDGIHYINNFENAGSNCWMVFDPTNIKRIDNYGTYDQANSDILFQAVDRRITNAEDKIKGSRFMLDVWTDSVNVLVDNVHNLYIDPRTGFLNAVAMVELPETLTKPNTAYLIGNGFDYISRNFGDEAANSYLNALSEAMRDSGLPVEDFFHMGGARFVVQLGDPEELNPLLEALDEVPAFRLTDTSGKEWEVTLNVSHSDVLPRSQVETQFYQAQKLSEQIRAQAYQDWLLKNGEVSRFASTYDALDGADEIGAEIATHPYIRPVEEDLERKNIRPIEALFQTADGARVEDQIDEAWRAFTQAPIFTQGNQQVSLVDFWGVLFGDAETMWKAGPRGFGNIAERWAEDLRVQGLVEQAEVFNSIANLARNFEEYVASKTITLDKIIPPPLGIWRSDPGLRMWVSNMYGVGSEWMKARKLLERWKDDFSREVLESPYADLKLSQEMDDVLTEVGRRGAKLKQDIKQAANYGGEINGVRISPAHGAVNETNFNMIDYTDFNRFDQLMKDIVPFWMYPIKSIPFWAKTMLQHPILVSFYYKYLRWTKIAARQMGATTSRGEELPSLKGYMPLLPGLWFNPLAPLFYRYVFPRVTEIPESDPDMGPLQHIAKFFLEDASLYGINISPVVSAIMQVFRDPYYPKTNLAYEYIAKPIFPIEYIPPFMERWILSKLKQVAQGKPSTPSRFIEEVDWRDYMIEREILMNALEKLNATTDTVEKERIGTEAYSIIIKPDRENDPHWIEARNHLDNNDYFRKMAGIFTGFYVKEFSSGQAELQALRDEVNGLRAAINDEVQAALFLPYMNSTDIYNLYTDRRYQTPDGYIWNAYTMISYVTDEEGHPAIGQARRDIIAQKAAEDEDTQQRYEALRVAADLRDERLRQVPVGADELLGKIWDEYFAAVDEIDRDDEGALYPLARKDYIIGYKPWEMFEEYATSKWWREIRSTYPNYQDGESWDVYQLRLEAWFDSLPDLAHHLAPIFETSLAYRVFDNEINAEERMDLVPELVQKLVDQTNREGYDKWELANDTSIDAIWKAYEELYLRPYYDAINGKKDPERSLAELEFLQTHTFEPSINEIYSWIQQKYRLDRFSHEQISADIQGLTFATPDEISNLGKTEMDKTAEEVWNILAWAGPRSSQNFKDLIAAYESLGGYDSDIDVFYAMKGEPGRYPDPEDYYNFLDRMREAAELVGAHTPTAEELQTEIDARNLNDAFLKLVDAELGANFTRNVLNPYFSMSSDERTAWRKQNKEEYAKIRRYYELKDAFAELHPEWVPYYYPSYIAAAAAAGGGGGTYADYGFSNRSISAEEAAFWIPMGRRSTLEARDLLISKLGAGGVVGRPWWPDSLRALLHPIAIQQVEQAAKGTIPLPKATVTYLKKVATKNPEYATIIRDNLELATGE